MYKKCVISRENEELSEFVSKSKLWQSVEKEYAYGLLKRSFDNNCGRVNENLQTIRIFISSTFKDFFNEREVLIKTVFPRLRRWCEERQLFLIECDLRWGVPQDATSEEAIGYCLEEIEKCRLETADNNFFLGLIGDRFGWVPEDDQLLSLLRHRFQWIDEASVTLMEIVHGAMRSGTDNCLFMARCSESHSAIPDSHRNFFVESRSPASDNTRQLRRFLHRHFAENLREYEAPFECLKMDPVSGKQRVTLSGMEQFADTVETFLKDKIESFHQRHLRVGLPESSSVNVTDEDTLQSSWLHSNLDLSVRRDDYLERLLERLRDCTYPIVLISGPAGIGKSSVMSHLVQRFQDHDRGTGVFFHFVGVSSQSHSLQNIRERLQRFLVKSKLQESRSHEDEESTDTLADILSLDLEKEVLVFIDALDELSDFSLRSLLPVKVGTGVRIVMSCISDSQAQSVYMTLTDAANPLLTDIGLEPMASAESHCLVETYLAKYGKRLDAAQMQTLTQFQAATNPLWLMSACEELRVHGDYSSLAKVIAQLPEDIGQIQRRILRRLLDQDRDGLLTEFLHVLLESRSGVYETVMRSVLQPETESVWLDLVRQVRGFLQVQTAARLRFRHRIVRECAQAELAPQQSGNLHAKLARVLAPLAAGCEALYSRDYAYHLIKSDGGRDELLGFMLSRPSWTVFRNEFTRGQVMRSIRCINPVHQQQQQKSTALQMCTMCSTKSGQLSLYSVNRNACLFCGRVVMTDQQTQQLFGCAFHAPQNARKCMLCGLMTGQGVPLKMCRQCTTSAGGQTKCGIIVRQNDVLYNQQLQFSRAVHRIENLI